MVVGFLLLRTNVIVKKKKKKKNKKKKKRKKKKKKERATLLYHLYMALVLSTPFWRFQIFLNFLRRTKMKNKKNKNFLRVFNSVFVATPSCRGVATNSVVVEFKVWGPFPSFSYLLV